MRSRELIRTTLFLLALLAMVFLPSFKLSKFNKVEPPFALPQVAFHGDSLIFSLESTQPPLALINSNGLLPVAINSRHLFIGIGLYDPPTISVSGVWKEKQTSNWVNFFNLLFSREVDYFSQKISVKRPFFKERKTRLRLPSSVWKRVRKKDPKKAQFRKVMKLVHQRNDGSLNPCWRSPAASFVNSEFGKPRYLPNGYRYFHSGVDLRARHGSPLLSLQDGEVVFADELVVSGKTIVSYHGAGITSQYMHMSRLDWKSGQQVNKASRLGLSGSSGRVEGPHLHWEIQWHGKKLNPLKFVEEMNQHCHQEKT